MISGILALADMCYPGYFLLIDKEVGSRERECTVYVILDAGREFYLLGRYQCICGRSKQRKKYRGDGKTPEGKYLVARITEFKFNRRFGPGFIKLNYPNYWDRREGRTGGGIGIHGGSRFTYTLGCVRVRNSDLLKIMKFITINDPVLIVPCTQPHFFPSLRRYRDNKFSYFSSEQLNRVLKKNLPNDECIKIISGGRRRYHYAGAKIPRDVGIIF